MPIGLTQIASFLLMVHPAQAPAPGVAAGRAQLEASDSGWSISDESAIDALLGGYREDVANQVRIEQHLQIRIAPRPGPAPMDLMFEESRSVSSPHYVEAKIGKCIPANNFASFSLGTGRRLFLFTRDNRIFSALLERSCESRDYYMGFYLAHSADAKLCVDRDRLLSRAGASCRLKQIRELIEVGD